MKDRLEYIDRAKGVAITLVVLGHTHNTHIELFVNLFHLSLFIFISGALWNEEKYSLHPVRLLSARFHTLYLPYLKYECIFFFLRPLLLRLKWYNPAEVSELHSICDYITGFLKIIICMGREHILGGFWFLIMLLFINIEFVTISFFSRKCFPKNYERIRFILVSLTFVFGILMSHYYVIPRFTPSLLGISFFYLGFLLQKRGIIQLFQEQLTNNKRFTLVTLLSIPFVVFLLNAYLKYGYISLSSSVITNPFYFLTAGILGIYVILVISFFLCRFQFGRFWSFIGEHSITLLALHEVAFKLITLLLILLFPSVPIDITGVPVGIQTGNYYLCYFFGGMTLCLLISFVIPKAASKIKIGQYK